VVNTGDLIKKYGVKWSPAPALYTVTLPSTFISTNASKLTSVATIGELSAYYFNSGQNGQILDIFVNISSKSSTKIVVAIYSANNVGKISISTLTFLQDAQYEHILGAYTIWKDFKSSFKNSAVTYDVYSVTLNPTINLTGLVNIPIMISGISAFPGAPTRYFLDVQVSAAAVSSSSVQITVSQKLGAFTALNRIQLVFIIYNQVYVNSAPSSLYRLSSGSFKVTSSSTQFSSCLSFSSTNTFVGLSSLTSSYNVISFNVQVNKNNILVSSDYPIGNGTFIFAYLVIDSSNV
jgi:hypothetical protein